MRWSRVGARGALNVESHVHSDVFCPRNYHIDCSSFGAVQDCLELAKLKLRTSPSELKASYW